ncbi:hypothetical protein QC764_0032360 [Podospora pseudoanserina]|uniref:Uncharacterized protein n=1 Tax=Podospora pseudoanserina TaxID=2609844 RepID=A0ABR0IFM2_9PEZI|nr:hypothetical protein QC764_0032360 [Podospora pseudoanserina]
MDGDPECRVDWSARLEVYYAMKVSCWQCFIAVRMGKAPNFHTGGIQGHWRSNIRSCRAHRACFVQ